MTGLFIITFVLQAFEIPSSSMENTLLDRRSRVREPGAVRSSHALDGASHSLPRDSAADIVVFLSPAEPGLYVVKRIIGVPGDHIHLRNGVVFRNGQKS